MPIYRNNDPEQGRYCMSPDGRVVYHEASQKTKTHDKQGNPTGWRECEETDISAFSDHLLVHCGRKAPEPEQAEKPGPNMAALFKVTATGTVE